MGEMDLNTLAQAWKDTSADLHKALTDQRDEIKKNGETTAKTGETIKSLETRLEAIQTDMVAKQEAIQKRIDDFESEMKRGGVGVPEFTKSVGELFTESQAYKTMLANGQLISSPVAFKSLIPSRDEVLKTTFLLSDQVSGFNRPTRMPPQMLVHRRLRIRDLIPNRRIGTSSIEFLEEVGFYDATATLSITIAQSAGVATATASGAHGLKEGWSVYVIGANQAGYNGFHIVTGVTSPTVFTYAVDTATVSPATGTITAINNGTNIGAASGVAEGSPKPEATLKFELRTSNTITVAHWLPVSRQALADTDQLKAIIDDRLMYGLEWFEEKQILYGSGTGQNLLGLLVNPNRQTYQWSQGTTGDTKVDALRRAMTQVQLAEYEVSGGVAHPKDWEDIQLVKGTDGHYLYLPVNSSGQAPTDSDSFFRVPFVITSSINQGQACVGAFGLAATLWDREEANIRVAEQHSDFFARNLVAILAEERIGLTTWRPQSFVDVSFNNAPP